MYRTKQTTNNNEDIRLTLHLLEQITGENGLEHSFFDIKSLDEVDLFIQHARVTRELREENARLKLENSRLAERLRQLELQHASVSNFGVFNADESAKHRPTRGNLG